MAKVGKLSTADTVYVLDSDGGKAVITGDAGTLKIVKDSLVKDGAAQIEVFDYGYFEE